MFDARKKPRIFPKKIPNIPIVRTNWIKILCMSHFEKPIVLSIAISFSLVFIRLLTDMRRLKIATRRINDISRPTIIFSS